MPANRSTSIFGSDARRRVNAGFSEANPQELYLPVIIDPEYHYESINVEAQQGSPASLLWWTRRMIALRKRHRAFGRGTLEWHNPDNRRVLCFTRAYEGETILGPGDAATFKAGVANGHHLVNRSARDAVLLEIGTRSTHERCHYPDVDLEFVSDEDGDRYVHRSGEPY